MFRREVLKQMMTWRDSRNRRPFSVDDVRTTEGRKSFRLINLPFYLIGNIEQIVKRFA